MEAELDAALKCEQQWAVVVAVPKEVRELSVLAEENEEDLGDPDGQERAPLRRLRPEFSSSARALRLYSS